MSRKVFLSFLGTNNYVPCYYYDEVTQEKSKISKYIQTAILELYGKKINDDDKCFFFLTKEAKDMNWLNDGQYNSISKKNDLENIGLKEQLSHLNINPESIVEKRIPEGFSSDEIWEIFNVIEDCIEKNDQIYLDITHAFRSIPMLGMSLLNYLKTIKDIEVKGIYYGAFEKLGRVPEVLKLDEKDRMAPIINLLTFSELQDWTLATNSFIRYGKTDQLKNIAETPILELARYFEGQEKDFNHLRDIFNMLNTFSNLIETNRGPDLRRFKFQDLKSKIDRIILSKNIYIPAYQANLKSIKNRIAEFDENDPLNFLRIVKWARDNGMLQQAITQLKEGITTYFAQKYNLPIEDEGVRNNIDRALYSLGDEKRSSENYLFGNPLSQDEEATALSKGFRNFSGDVRNDINHNGMRKGASNAKNLKRKFDDFFLLVQEQLKERTTTEKTSSSNLLNLSNHPSTLWGSNQKKSAERLYERIQDLPFPQISPDWDENQLDDLVQEYLVKIQDINPSAVHIMGEMTFTHRLVNRLKEVGITCIASTTQRDVVEEDNGIKTSTFKFIKFRKY